MFSYSRNCLAKRILWNKYAMLWLSCHRTSLPTPQRPRNSQKASHHPQLPVSGILLNHSAAHLFQHLVPCIHPLMSWFLWTLAPYNHFRLSLLQWPLWICLCDLLTSCSAQLNSWLYSHPHSTEFWFWLHRAHSGQPHLLACCLETAGQSEVERIIPNREASEL